MRVVIFSGTTEGRRLSAQTAAMGAETIVCVATEYGRTVQEQVPGAQTLSGRLDAEQMAEVLRTADLCIDATHPYAREASRNIRAAARAAKVPCRRLLRRESELPPDCLLAEDAAESLSDAAGLAAEKLSEAADAAADHVEYAAEKTAGTIQSVTEDKEV